MMGNIREFGDRAFVKSLIPKSGGASAPPLFVVYKKLVRQHAPFSDVEPILFKSQTI